MAEKEGLRLTPKGIGMAVGAMILTIAAGLGGFTLSSGASTEATEGIVTLIETTIDERIDERESTMTLEEAEVWRAKEDRQRHVDTTLVEHGKALQKLQTTVDGNTHTLQAIFDKVGASE